MGKQTENAEQCLKSEHVDTLYVQRNVTGSPEEREKVSNGHYSSSIAKDQPWMEEDG